MTTTNLWGNEVLEPHEAAALMRALTGRPFYTMTELAARPFSEDGQDSWRHVFAHILTLNDIDVTLHEDAAEPIARDMGTYGYLEVVPCHDRFDNDRYAYAASQRDIEQCESCSTYGLAFSWVDNGDTRLCESCIEDCYSCQECGESYCSEYRADRCCPTRYSCGNCGETYEDEDDADRCCMSEDDDESDEVHSYGYKPAAILHASDLERDVPSHYFGVEIEIEQSNGNHFSELADILRDDSGDDHYLKHDGSIDNGVELVTHPRSLLSWQDAYEGQLGAILERAARNGARAWDASRCGLHVHVSRTAFKSDAHLYRFTKLAEDNAPAFTRFAGRRSEQWASFDKDKRGSERINAVQSKWTGMRQRNPGARYMAVNLQNTDTVELRFFRPSLKVRSVVAAVELVDAMVAYTRTVTSNQVITENALAWTPFALFLTLNAATYPRAHEVMVRRVGAPTPETAAE